MPACTVVPSRLCHGSTVVGAPSKGRCQRSAVAMLVLYIKRTWKRLPANPSRACNHIATKPPHRFGTPTVECSRGGDVRKCTSAEERAAKNQKTTVCHLRRKYADFCARFARCYCGSAVIEISLPIQTASSPPFFYKLTSPMTSVCKMEGRKRSG